MTMSEENTSIDSWDGLLTNYLKAENLTEQETTLVCSAVAVDGKQLELTVWVDENKFIFSLNKTNMAFLKSHEIKIPKEVVGKKLTLEKVKAFNPTTKKEVDSLRICRIE